MCTSSLLRRPRVAPELDSISPGQVRWLVLGVATPLSHLPLSQEIGLRKPSDAAVSFGWLEFGVQYNCPIHLRATGGQLFCTTLTLGRFASSLCVCVCVSACLWDCLCVCLCVPVCVSSGKRVRHEHGTQRCRVREGGRDVAHLGLTWLGRFFGPCKAVAVDLKVS